MNSLYMQKIRLVENARSGRASESCSAFNLFVYYY